MFSNASGWAFCTRGRYSEGGAANSKWLTLSREQDEKIGLSFSCCILLSPGGKHLPMDRQKKFSRQRSNSKEWQHLHGNNDCRGQGQGIILKRWELNTDLQILGENEPVCVYVGGAMVYRHISSVYLNKKYSPRASNEKVLRVVCTLHWQPNGTRKKREREWRSLMKKRWNGRTNKRTDRRQIEGMNKNERMKK